MSVQEQMAQLEDYGVLACMDRRLFGLEARTGVTVLKTAGGIIPKDSEEVRAAIEKHKVWFVLSHDDCAMMKLFEAAKNGEMAVPHEIVKDLVEPLKHAGCTNCHDAEKRSPEVQSKAIQDLAQRWNLGEKRIITGCIETPKMAAHTFDTFEVVITTPLESTYRELGIDTSNNNAYFLHNNLFATESDIWVATKKGVRSIKVISQKASEDLEVSNFAEYISKDAGLKSLGVRVTPILYRDRIMERQGPRAPEHTRERKST
jgi:hypothetical protein